MKNLLLILLLSFNVQAITFTQIDNLTVNKSIYPLMLRLGFDYQDFEIAPKINEDDVRSKYERIVMEGVLIKPTFPEMQAELALYKADLVIIEQARLEGQIEAT